MHVNAKTEMGGSFLKKKNGHHFLTLFKFYSNFVDSDKLIPTEFVPVSTNDLVFVHYSLGVLILFYFKRRSSIFCKIKTFQMPYELNCFLIYELTLQILSV